MKQFRIDFSCGGASVFDLASATEHYGSEVTKGLDSLAVRESCVDCDGDTWTRLPDVGDEPQSADQARKDRRERIATVAMAALLTLPRYYRYAAEAGQEACKAADALIAALDAAE